MGTDYRQVFRIDDFLILEQHARKMRLSSYDPVQSRIGTYLVNSFTDPLFVLFKHIRLQADCSMWHLVNRFNLGAVSIPFAMPKSTAPTFDDKANASAVMSDLLNQGAVHFMSVIEGDGSPESYLEAVVLDQLIHSSYCFWHGNRVYGTPTDDLTGFCLQAGPDSGLQYVCEPGDWSGFIERKDGEIRLQYYSFTSLYGECILQNSYLFNGQAANLYFGEIRGAYVSEYSQRVIATGDEGVVW